MALAAKADRESHVRSLLKGMTWRFLATATTTSVAWLMSGDVSLAITIGGIEFFAKFFIYYGHERAWAMVPSGTFQRFRSRSEKDSNTESRLRSLLKGLTWRCVATATTMVIAWRSSGDVTLAVSIGKIEFPAKLLIYYLHERAWLLLPRGTFRRRVAKSADPDQSRA